MPIPADSRTTLSLCFHFVILWQSPDSRFHPHVTQVDENRKFRAHVPGKRFLTSGFTTQRSVYGTVTLARGRYVVLACTGGDAALCRFMLRLYTSEPGNVRYATGCFEENGVATLCVRCPVWRHCAFASHCDVTITPYLCDRHYKDS